MQNYTTAVHVLRAYFQDRLKHHLPEYWGGKNPPIIPAQQQPEVVEGDTPFLVYIGSFGPTSDLFQYQTEVFNCSIYSTSPAKIAAITKLAINLFNRYDISAERINNWIGRQPDVVQGAPNPFKQFEFKTVYLTGAVGAQPATSEAGRNDGEIEVTIEYVDVEDEFADSD